MIVKHIPETHVFGKRLGRHVHHDPRSHNFKHAALPVLTSQKWVRHCEVYDQGELGSCTGNAMAGAIMTGPLYKPTRVLHEAQAVRLYRIATRLDDIDGQYPPDDTGSSGLAVCKAAKQFGYIKGYTHAMNLQAALSGLVHGPVIIGIAWFEGFDSPIGSAAELQISGSIRGGHEVVLDAIDVDHKYVSGTNSWGPTWGARGKFCMTWDTFGELLNQEGDCTIPK